MKILFNRLSHLFAQLLFSPVKRNGLFKKLLGERVALGFYILAQN